MDKQRELNTENAINYAHMKLMGVYGEGNVMLAFGNEGAIDAHKAAFFDDFYQTDFDQRQIDEAVSVVKKELADGNKDYQYYNLVNILKANKQAARGSRNSPESINQGQEYWSAENKRKHEYLLANNSEYVAEQERLRQEEIAKGNAQLERMQSYRKLPELH